MVFPPAQTLQQHLAAHWPFVGSAELRQNPQGLTLCLWVGNPVPWAAWVQLPAIARSIATHVAITGVQVNELGVIDAEALASIYCADINAPD
jgi:hypothetical protein